MNNGWPLALFAIAMCNLFVYLIAYIDLKFNLSPWHEALIILGSALITVGSTGAFGVMIGIIK